MAKILLHTRITQLPAPEPICAGHLDSFKRIAYKTTNQLILDYHAIDPAQHAEIVERNGCLSEHVDGLYRPRRLRFVNIDELQVSGVIQDLDNLPFEHPARIIVDMYNWQIQGDNRIFFLLFGRSAGDAEIRFYASKVKWEERPGDPIPYNNEWDWSPAPPMPSRIVPRPKTIHKRFGGDPVIFAYHGKVYNQRLFVGGLDIQPEERPDVHAILNLGEHPSAWMKGRMLPDTDRWENMGEGSQGMSIYTLQCEAEWVIDRLHRGERVLVHCTAGMNRSVTVCCAVLILLEGLTAEDALVRVRQHHPWARPDGHHWLALKWLAKDQSASTGK